MAGAPPNEVEGVVVDPPKLKEGVVVAAVVPVPCPWKRVGVWGLTDGEPKEKDVVGLFCGVDPNEKLGVV